jgi:hypothetical protein
MSFATLIFLTYEAYCGLPYSSFNVIIIIKSIILEQFKNIPGMKYPSSSIAAVAFASKNWSQAAEQYSPSVYDAPEVLAGQGWVDPPREMYAVGVGIMYDDGSNGATASCPKG